MDRARGARVLLSVVIAVVIARLWLVPLGDGLWLDELGTFWVVKDGWGPTVDNYLGRVPKARILQAVREGKGKHAA